MTDKNERFAGLKKERERERERAHSMNPSFLVKMSQTN